MAFHELIQDPESGLLRTVPTKALKDFYQTAAEPVSPDCYNCSLSPEGDISSETLGAILYDIPEDCFSVELEFEAANAHEFGIALHTDKGLETGVFPAYEQEPQSGGMGYVAQIRKGILPMAD